MSALCVRAHLRRTIPGPGGGGVLKGLEPKYASSGQITSPLFPAVIWIWERDFSVDLVIAILEYALISVFCKTVSSNKRRVTFSASPSFY